MPSPVFCGHYGECGGCDFQDTEYAAQLQYKSTYCRNLFASFGCDPDPIIPSPAQRFFRNKMEFAVTGTCDTPVIGERMKERFDRVVDLRECPVSGERYPELLASVRSWIRETRTAPYDLRKATGELRYVSIKEAKASRGIMLTMVVALDGAAFAAVEERYRALAWRLMEKFPVRSVFACLNPGRSDNAINGAMVHLAGDDHIIETVNGVRYVIRPGTFFQTNPGCCERLYAAVLGCCEGMEERVYDVYCGSGGITLQLARAGRRATGIDLSRRNIADAAENAAANGLDCDFVCSDADRFIAGIGEGAPWSMVVDPPRGGLTPAFIKVILAHGPGRLVYVSCNPLKLREDLKKMAFAYTLDRLIPVDMFPHTRHFEVVALLVRQK